MWNNQIIHDLKFIILVNIILLSLFLRFINKQKNLVSMIF